MKKVFGFSATFPPVIFFRTSHKRFVKNYSKVIFIYYLKSVLDKKLLVMGSQKQEDSIKKRIKWVLRDEDSPYRMPRFVLNSLYTLGINYNEPFCGDTIESAYCAKVETLNKQEASDVNCSLSELKSAKELLLIFYKYGHL